MLPPASSARSNTSPSSTPDHCTTPPVPNPGSSAPAASRRATISSSWLLVSGAWPPTTTLPSGCSTAAPRPESGMPSSATPSPPPNAGSSSPRRASGRRGGQQRERQRADAGEQEGGASSGHPCHQTWRHRNGAAPGRPWNPSHPPGFRHTLARFMPARVALVHDFLLDLRGAERVFAALCDAWPDADVFTAVYDPRGTEGRFADRRPRTSFLQRLRPTSRTFRPLLPLYPHAIESLDLRELRRRRHVLERLGARRPGRSRRRARLLLPQPVPLRVDGARGDAAGAQPARAARAAPAAQPLAPVGLDRRPAGRPLRRQLARDRRADRALLRAQLDRAAPAGGARPLQPAAARRRSATSTSCWRS